MNLPEPWGLIGADDVRVRQIDVDTLEVKAPDGRMWLIDAREVRPDDDDDPDYEEPTPEISSQFNEDQTWCDGCMSHSRRNFTTLAIWPNGVMPVGGIDYCFTCSLRDLQEGS